MTVPVQNPVAQHVANGITTVFSFEFLCLQERDLIVAVDGEVVDPIEYAVTGLGTASGAVTFNSPPADGLVVVIYMEVVLARDTNYQYSGDFLTPVVNPDFDRIWLALQSSKARALRALQLGLGDTDGSGAYRANNNRIQDVGNPVDMHDAANKQFVAEEISRLATDGSGEAVVERLADGSDPSNGSGMVAFKQSGADSQLRTLQSKVQEIISPADFSEPFDPEASNPFEGTISYGGWTTPMGRNGYWLRAPAQYGSIKATPSDAELLPEYYWRIPYMQTHPGDIYPVMALGYKQDWPVGMRSTRVGYWAGAGSVQVDVNLNPVATFTPLCRHFGLPYEPLAWSTLFGERAGRLCKDYSPTMVGQQAGLEAVGYASNFFGRQAGQYSRGPYNHAWGVNAGDHMFGERNMAFGHEAGQYAMVSFSVLFGQRAGANSALSSSVAIGYLSMQTGTGSANTALGNRAAQNIRGDHNTAIGNQASVSVAESGLSFAIDASGVDIPGNRFKMPNGTAASIGLSDGDYVRLDWNGSGMTRPPKAYGGSSSGVFAFILDGTDEWLYASTFDSVSGYEIQTSSKLYWYASSQNDSVPASNSEPTVWDAVTEYSTRDTVTTPNAPGEVFLWIRTQDQSPSIAPEPKVGDGWEDYWVQTEPGSGSITFTPYRKVNSATAVGSLASARHENAIALGRGATTTAANQCVIGNASLAEVRIPSLAAYKCGDTLMVLGRTGTPEGALTAPKGSICTRVDGAAGTTLYVKESGTGNTGWVAK